MFANRWLKLGVCIVKWTERCGRRWLKGEFTFPTSAIFDLSVFSIGRPRLVFTQRASPLASAASWAQTLAFVFLPQSSWGKKKKKNRNFRAGWSKRSFMLQLTWWRMLIFRFLPPCLPFHNSPCVSGRGEGRGGEGGVGSLQHHQQCTEELLRVKARWAAAPVGVSSAAPLH